MVLLYVVSRDAPDTYAYLKKTFTGVDEVEIVLDRRRAERRQAISPPSPSDRRRADRRTTSVNRDLGTLGWALLVKR